MKFILGFLACLAATALVLAAVHGASHLTVNTGAVLAVTGGIAFGLCVLARIVSGIVGMTTGSARAWWPSLAAVALVGLGGLYLIEITAV